MKLFFGLLLFAITAVVANPAAARGSIPYGTYMSMTPASATDYIDNDGGALTLCVMRTKYHLAFLGAWSKQEYVVAPNNCDSDGFYDYSPEELAKDREEGALSEDVPDTPAITFDFLFYGFSMWWAVLAVVIFSIIKSKLFPGKDEEVA